MWSFFFIKVIVFIQVLLAHDFLPSTRLMPVPTTCPKPTLGELCCYFKLCLIHLTSIINVVFGNIIKRILFPVETGSSVDMFLSGYGFKMISPFFPVLIGLTFLRTSTMTNCTTSCSLLLRRPAASLWSELSIHEEVEQHPGAMWFQLRWLFSSRMPALPREDEGDQRYSEHVIRPSFCLIIGKNLFSC